MQQQKRFKDLGFFTCPENVGKCCFHMSRKSGRVLFSRVPKIWASAVFTSPENLGECCFHVSRKNLVCYFTFPENVGECCFHVSRKSGGVVFSMTTSTELRTASNSLEHFFRHIHTFILPVLINSSWHQIVLH